MTASVTGLVNDFGENQSIGSHHYRAWVGPPEYYDRIGALQFTTLVRLGLREHHRVLDVGCGSLRGGRLSIMYLRPGHYFGIEPTSWALEDGIKAHLGAELVEMKQPTFSNDANYTLTTFGGSFDFIMVHSVFTHAPANHIRRCLDQAKTTMGPTSIFLATYLEGTEDHRGDEWVYPWVTQYTQEGITAMVAEAGLRCTHLDLTHPFDQRWFAATLPDSDVDVKGRVARDVFSYETYLQDELERFGGVRRSHADYLRAELTDLAGERRNLPR